MTLQTIYISVVSLLGVVAYFLWNLMERGYPDPEGSGAPAKETTNEKGQKYTVLPGTNTGQQAMYTVIPMQGYARITTNEKNDITPILTQAWSDAAVPTEGLFILAVLGIAKEVVTADAGRIFLSTVIGTVLHAALVRILYEGYMFKTHREGTHIHRMAAFTGIATLWNGFVIWFLVYERYTTDGTYANVIVILYTVFTSIAPVILWIFYFIMLDWDTTMIPIDFKNSLHNVARVSFHLAVFIRLVFIAFVLGGVDRSSNKDLSNIYFQFTG
jgi:hypothetical protein